MKMMKKGMNRGAGKMPADKMVGYAAKGGMGKGKKMMKKVTKK